jgi:hypothetical protein
MIPESLLEGLPKERHKAKRSRLVLIREGKERLHILERQEDLEKVVQ